MDLEVKWHSPIKLKNGHSDGLIYKIDNIDDWSDVAGIYIFCRKYSGKIIPLYIGKAENIGRRIKQNLNSLKLMKGIESALSGDKYLVVGEFIAKRGQNKKKSIALIEKGLIEHSLSEGHELLNIQGTKISLHSVSFSGYREAKNLTGKLIYIKAK